MPKEQTKLQTWKTILKEDKDYDWVFFLRLIVYKLKRMRHLFETAGHHEGDQQIAAQMTRVIELLERVSDEEDYHEQEAAKLKPGAKFMVLYRLEERLKQKDLDEAFKLISKYVRSWWD